MRTLNLENIIDRAGDLYHEMSRGKTLPLPKRIRSDQVKAIAQALVEAINQANSNDIKLDRAPTLPE